MSEERFDRIDGRLDGLERGQVALRADMDRRFQKVDERFAEVDRRFDQIDQRFEKVDERFDKIDRRFEKVDERLDKIDQRFEKVDERFDEQGRHMRMLFDEAIERIEAAVDPTALLAAVDRRIGELGDRIDRRLDPIEAAIRQHSVDIEQLKNARG